MRPVASHRVEERDEAGNRNERGALTLAAAHTVLEFWKNSGLSLHYSEDALCNATLKCEIATLEWWRRSGLSLKIGKVLDFASREGSTSASFSLGPGSSS